METIKLEEKQNKYKRAVCSLPFSSAMFFDMSPPANGKKARVNKWD